MSHFLNTDNLARSKRVVSISSHATIHARGLTEKREIFITKLMGEIELSYQNPEFTIDELALSLAMSKRQLYRKCNAYLKMNPGFLLREYRLDVAVLLIKEGEVLRPVLSQVQKSKQLKPLPLSKKR